MPRKRNREREDKIQYKIDKLQRKLVKKRRREKSPTPSVILSDENQENEQENIPPETEEPTDIDPEMLSALGNATDPDKLYGDEVHPEIIKRVEHILTSGFKKDAKEELLKKYNIPKNATLLDAPKLNLELEGLLSESIKSRDTKVQSRQQQLGIAIASILKLTDNVIKKECDNIKIVSVLSDTAKLLSDLHYEDTNTRRKLIAPNLDKNIVKTIELSKRDVFLFGEKFNENVKAASAIKKSATLILKPNPANQQPKKVNYQTNQVYKKQENFHAPPRSSQYKQRGGGKYQPRASGRPAQQRAPVKPYQRKPVRQS